MRNLTSNFFVSFWNWLVLLSQMYVTWSNKKAPLLFFWLRQQLRKKKIPLNFMDVHVNSFGSYWFFRKNVSWKYCGFQWRAMLQLNISCYIWSSLNSVVWIMVKRSLHSLLPEYESFSSRLLWVPPSVSNGGSALMSWWFLKLQSLCILAMHLKSQSGLLQKWSFFLFSCGMDHQCVLTGSPFEWYKRLRWYLRTIMNSLFSRYSSMTYFLSTSRWNRWRRHLTRSGPSVGSSLQDDGKRWVSYHTDLRTRKKSCYGKSR